MATIPHSEKGIRTLEAINADPFDWALCPVEWSWELMEVPTDVTCSSCNGRGRIYPEGVRGSWNATPCVECKGKGTVKELREREVEVGRLVWPEGTTFPSPHRAGHRCDLCGKPIYKSNLIPMLGRTKDGAPIGLFTGSDCAGKLWDVAKAADWNLVSIETATLYRDTTRQTEEAKARAAAAKAEKAAALAAKLAAGDPLGREIDAKGKPIAGALKAQATAEMGELARHISEHTQSNMSEVHLNTTRETASGMGYKSFEFKITPKGGAKLTTYDVDSKVIWQDKAARNASEALSAAIAALKTPLG